MENTYEEVITKLERIAAHAERIAGLLPNNKSSLYYHVPCRELEKYLHGLEAMLRTVDPTAE